MNLRMEPTRIAELLSPFLDQSHDRRLTTNDLQHISTYIDILLRWNARMNLTAIRSEEEIVTRHFGESFFAARHLFPRISLNTSVPLADIGSGAGFPGIPIKLWAPEIALTLIESNQKKATFLREVVRVLKLTNVNIENARAETLPPATFNVVTLRAVERFADVLPAAARLLAGSGRLALLIASSQLAVAHSLPTGMSWDQPVPIPGSRSRIVLVGRQHP
jgi:16S rRNA (guanine527-N7)-methyltransferase